jgi:hypothetical protein
MKKLTTTMFAALIGLALTMPAMAQNTQPAPAKTTQGDTSKDKDNKKSSTSKKNSKKKSSKKNTTDSSTTTPPKK